MKAIRTILACMRKADQTFNLINHGDKIVVGLSGGKDSVALLYCLNLYQKFSHTNFIVQPVYLDLGFPNSNSEPLKQFCHSLGYDLHIENCQDVYKILTIQQEKQHLNHLPCSICSKMKKAAINKVANNIKFNKVAFAHHVDDAIETLFMNMIYGGRFATFSPKMILQRANITFIRPFIKVHEKDIIRLIKEENLPVFASGCPADKTTSRQDIKNILNNFKKKYPTSEDNFLNALTNYHQLDLWSDEIYYQVNQKGLTIKPVVTSIDKYHELKIRQKVFEKEQSVSFLKEYVDDQELISESFLICFKNKIIGCVRYINQNRQIIIQRLAILKPYRHKGYGYQVMMFLNDFLKSKYTPATITIHAQYYLKDFYLKLGYNIQGKSFYEAKIKHITMVKNI